MHSTNYTLSFTLSLPPKANKETQFVNGHAYTPAEKVKYMMRASKRMRKHKGKFAGVRFISIAFVFVCPRTGAVPADLKVVSGLWKKQVSLYKPSRPDLDNYEKVIQDCLSHHTIRKIKNKEGDVIMRHKGAGVVDDDSYFVSKSSVKIYAKLGESPHIRITIKALDPVYSY